jgi:transmembrane sensor
MSSAKETQARAVEWLLERRDREDWSVQDQEQLDAWLAQSPSHLVAYWRAEDGWSRTELLSAFRTPMRAERGAQVVGISLRRALVRITAVLVVVICGAAAAYYILGMREQVYATGIGGKRSIVLADGSRIDLNTDTTVRTRFGNGARLVTVDKGEAYFQVKHDPGHPFVVTAAGNRIVDLGTKFIVRNNTDRLEVSLLEGRARFEPADDTRGGAKVLVPGDVVIATPTSIATKRKTLKAVANELGWQRGVVVFDNTSLSDAVSELNRYNRKKLIIADSSVARMTIVGTFPVNDIALVLEAAKDVYGLHVRDDRDEAVISR